MNKCQKNWQSFRHNGFSLIEVVIATGLCTFALLTISSLLPVGMVTIQNASTQVVEAEIFNRLWSQFDTTPFYSLQNTNNSVNALFPTPASAIYFYYDQESQDITPPGTNPVAPTGTVYTTRCTLVNAQTNPSLETTVPIVNGVNSSGPSLTFIQIQIGFHFDPANLQQGTNDPRVATRTFLIAKRDTWDGS